MGLKEMLQGTEEFSCVFDSALVQRHMNILDDHVPDGLTAVRLIQQITGQSCSGDVWYVLMFADRGNFIRVQAAKVDAVLQRDHDRCSHLKSLASNLRLH
jgi:hypothetical protein